MALFLTESEVDELLTMDSAIDAVERGLKAWHEGNAENSPRSRVRSNNGHLHLMGASILDLDSFGFKAYSTYRGGARFHCLLYDGQTGELLALLQAGRLGQIRTGAASGVASKYLSSVNASILGVYGTGVQAETQIEGVCAVRPINEVRVYSRNAEKRSAFAQKMTDRLGIETKPVQSPSMAAEGAEIVVVATSAQEPVMRGEWLEAGTLVNAIGVNAANKQEIDRETVRRSALVVVDDVEQAKLEAGDLIPSVEAGELTWDSVYRLDAVVAGEVKRGAPQDIVLFESQGIALEDVAVTRWVYDLARKRGLGTELRI